MKTLYIDFETRSDIDLRRTNAYVYFDSKNTDVWCAAYSFGDEEPRLWFPEHGRCPEAIAEHIVSGGLIYAWNAAFERLAWREVLGPRYGWLVPKLEQYRCVMAQAYAMALPGKLEHAALALGVSEVKDMAGHRLMLKMAAPRNPRRGEPTDVVYWHDDPGDLMRLAEYCRQDVKTEVAVFNRLPPLHDLEQQVWFLDQKINDRGIFVDEALCKASNDIIRDTTCRLDSEIRWLTGGAVRGVANVAGLIGYAKMHGLETGSIAKDVISELLVRDDLEPNVRRALEIRQEGAKTSTAKISAMLARRQRDGRLRGTLQYHGASTGRWAGRGAQTHNLPRPTLKGDLEPVIEDLLHGDSDIIELLHGPPLSVVSDCLRSMLTATPPGDIIRSVDFSGIEARVVAWLAGEHKALDVFLAYDAKTGPHPYNVTAAGLYNVPVESVSAAQRQVGKVASLALGYQGGPGAFAKMAKGYGLDIGEIFDTVREAATPENWERAQEDWEHRGQATGMSERKWFAAELIKLAWRDKHPHIRQWWTDIEHAVLEAVESPGKVTRAGAHVSYRRAGSWLLCRLPSSRVIAYAYPRIVRRTTPWGNVRPSMVYKGVGISKQWEEQDFYGGLGSENVTQAVARDVMRDAMLRSEVAGYKLILTVHDELVSETRADFGSLDEFKRLSAATPDWAPGLPIAVEGWEGGRYRK